MKGATYDRPHEKKGCIAVQCTACPHNLPCHWPPSSPGLPTLRTAAAAAMQACGPPAPCPPCPRALLQNWQWQIEFGASAAALRIPYSTLRQWAHACMQSKPKSPKLAALLNLAPAKPQPPPQSRRPAAEAHAVARAAAAAGPFCASRAAQPPLSPPLQRPLLNTVVTLCEQRVMTQAAPE